MNTKCKVRADFDKSQPITVNVSGCSDDIKKQVQQAFFDVGIEWFSGRIGPESEAASFRYLDAVLYTNSSEEGSCCEYLMYGTVSRTDSISHKQFLELVYEPKQQGHIHAHLMAQYAEDAKATDKPWKLWQVKVVRGEWRDLTCDAIFASHLEYRRKPKTHLVHGVEVPDIRPIHKTGEKFYFPNPTSFDLYSCSTIDHGKMYSHLVTNNLCYEYTEAGKQAAILHAKAMLGIA